jgi:hypothetical protein
MAYVQPVLPDLQIVRCYNGVTGSSAGNCGFTATRIGTGQYIINFGFDVNHRFAVVQGHGNYGTHYYDSGSGGTNAIYLELRAVAGNLIDGAFTILVY